MNNARLFSAILAALLLVPVLSRGARAVAPAGPPTTLVERVELELQAVATPASGATRHVGSASGAHPYIATGFFDASGRPVDTLCSNATGTPADEARGSVKAVHLWSARARLLAATMDALTFEVDWSRDTAARPGRFERVAGGTRTITLREGEAHTLDAVTSPNRSDRCAANLRIDVVPRVIEVPELAAERIAYEMWLLDEAPGRRPIVRRLQAAARQGEAVAFAFPALRWDAPGARAADGRGFEVVAEISGALRGRAREDGAIDLLIDAGRWLGLAPAGGPRPGGIGDGGRRTLRVISGETVSLVLPTPSGSHALALDGTGGAILGGRPTAEERAAPGSGAGGVFVGAGEIRVAFSPFFTGHTMSLRVTARRDTDR